MKDPCFRVKWKVSKGAVDGKNTKQNKKPSHLKENEFLSGAIFSDHGSETQILVVPHFMF